MLAGQTITGTSRSITVMVKFVVEFRPAASVATQLTIVTPFGKAEPLGGVQALRRVRAVVDRDRVKGHDCRALRRIGVDRADVRMLVTFGSC